MESSSSSPPIFPLSWENPEEKWWYVYPIELAAANGYYEIVQELLHINPNLLIKLTSLRRIQRLETVWDSDLGKFKDVAKCRALVARKLLMDCDTTITSSSSSAGGGGGMIEAGYGGWILYTALSAGDIEFVKELIDRNPVLVFGEGEFKFMDLVYAAGRSKCDQVFKMLVNSALSMKNDDESKWEIVNKSLHGLATSGNVELLKKELGLIHHHVLDYRDSHGSTILHTAASKGQVQVVKHLISTYPDMTDAIDNQGNKPIHIAAYRGFSLVIEPLLHHSPKSVTSINNEGKTPLHLAVSAPVPSEAVVRQLISVHDSINLNFCDRDGFTPLDLLRQRPNRTATLVQLIKKLVSVGGVSSSSSMLYGDDWRVTRSEPLGSHLRHQGHGGISFRVMDSGIEYSSGDEYDYNDDDDQLISSYYSDDDEKRNHQFSSTSDTTNRSSNSVTKRLKEVFQFTKKRNVVGEGNQREEYSENGDNDNVNDSSDLVMMMKQSLFDQTKTMTLRERFTKESSTTSYNTTVLTNNKRVRVIPINFPMSPTTTVL